MVILQVKDLSVTIQSKIIFENLSFDIEKGKQYAIVGPSGSGKSTVLKCLAGQSFYKGSIGKKAGVSIVFVEQQHHFKNLSNTSSFYYQQRFNSIDAEDALQVQDYFQSSSYANETLELLGINRIWNKRLIQLSNGENKRVQIAKALLEEPDVLLLDNPFLGLDKEARGILNELFDSAASRMLTIILVTSTDLIPPSITNVLELAGDKSWRFTTKENFQPKHSLQTPFIKLDKNLLDQLVKDQDDDFDVAVKMKNVQVQYSGISILNKINWEVKKRERWSLSGPNGAGKSTLLSLINADNPQAYANEIYLFDKRRGKGESIWDIKKKIGFVSPELHLYFESSISAFNAVASGLFDTIGLFRQLNDEQIITTKNWMRLLHIDHLSNQLLFNLPLGSQRLILLARALVKNPPLLLLDEPAQGLDDDQRKLLKSIIEQICEHAAKTLIYVTHLKEEVPDCVNRFIVLKEGRISALV
jgi:molybdate transport system ATP-binding protein